MLRFYNLALALTLGCCALTVVHAYPISDNSNGTFKNPLIWADVPDLCVTRVGDTYYMVSTTMHMAPGIPVMRSKDLVNWEIVSYCYAEIDHGDAHSLKNGKNDYASGSWASNIRYDEKLKRFFVINACNTTDKSYIFSTDNIEKGQWRCDVVAKCYDPGLILDGDNRYVIYGQQGHHYREIFVEPTTFKVTLGPEKEWRKVMSHDGNKNWVEGAHGIKRGEYYYIPVIELRERRVQSVWRGKDINDPSSWEARKIFSGDIRDKDGKVILPSTGVAQGGFVDTPNGDWYALLFQDYGSVGRIPVLIPMRWTDDGWPVLGNDGKSVAEVLPMSGKPQKQKTDIVISDEFENGPTRHIFSDKEVGTGITAGLFIEQINNLLKKTAVAGNLIANGDFENVDSSMWTVNGGGGLGKLTIEQEAGGAHVMKVSQRKATIAGPSQKLDGKLEPGATYRVSVRVRYDDYTDVAGQNITAVSEREFKVTLFLDGKFGDVAIQRVPKGQWTTITGSYTVPANANVADVALFYETTWVPTGDFSEAENKVKHTFDFLVDDVTLAKDVFSDLIAKNEYGYNGSNLKLQWQWNHNPNNNLWSLTDREGYLRLKSGLRSRTIRDARNTLTQRTFGPTSSGCTTMDVTNMRDGDVAGLAVFQNQYGFVGVKMEGGKKYLVMQRAQKKDDAAGKVMESIPLTQNSLHLKVDCDFGAEKKDKAYFYYSLDGKTWKRIGDTLQMAYDWPDFMGYRFGLFYYSTERLGGWVDFDYFRVSDMISGQLSALGHAPWLFKSLSGIGFSESRRYE